MSVSAILLPNRSPLGLKYRPPWSREFSAAGGGEPVGSQNLPSPGVIEAFDLPA
jgi:hypothetical protein